MTSDVNFLPTCLSTRCLMVSTDQANPIQNFMNIDGTMLILFFLSSPPFNAGPQKPPALTASKIKYENF